LLTNGAAEGNADAKAHGRDETLQGARRGGGRGGTTRSGVERDHGGAGAALAGESMRKKRDL